MFFANCLCKAKLMFSKHHPSVISFSASLSNPTFCKCQIIVNNDDFFHSILTETYIINTKCIPCAWLTLNENIHRIVSICSYCSKWNNRHKVQTVQNNRNNIHRHTILWKLPHRLHHQSMCIYHYHALNLLRIHPAQCTE